MAKLPLETTATISRLKQQFLDIIDRSSKTEFSLFEQFGEIEETLPYLDEMKNVENEALSSFSQLSNLQIRIAQSQPAVAPDLLELLNRAIVRTQNRIPALERSIEEVTSEWNLL
jgi:3-methyladenine DNA glycosylase/8-oxoguanine DNA glycosylase